MGSTVKLAAKITFSVGVFPPLFAVRFLECVQKLIVAQLGIHALWREEEEEEAVKEKGDGIMHSCGLNYVPVLNVVHKREKFEERLIMFRLENLSGILKSYE